MTLFLRDSYNNTIADIEYYVAGEHDHKHLELHSVVDIQRYSELLLANPEQHVEVITDFQFIQELRGWLWESYFMGGNNSADKYDDVLTQLRIILKEIADKYMLSYVED